MTKAAHATIDQIMQNVQREAQVRALRTKQEEKK